MPNATVVVAELGRVTTTNAEGRFVLRGLPAGEYHLSITLLGFAPGHEVVRVPTAGDAINIEITMVRSPLRMTAVVVSASPTGTETDRLTQSALELSGKSLSRSLSSSLGTTLASEPGISQRFAGPGASMPIIRGLTGDRILVLQRHDYAPTRRRRLRLKEPMDAPRRERGERRIRQQGRHDGLIDDVSHAHRLSPRAGPTCHAPCTIRPP